MNPSDLTGMLSSVGAMQNPKGVALSFLGLSPDEQRAGIPAWAWAILALGAGVYLGNKYAPSLKGIFK
jgi:hypothetical protein